ncbi:DinB family protein [Synoicihabitans lomoniglobus]|uniref:DinB family protein n=1 Tax=Synoicihabitans lomoniglobus TaxID=2909285 RepID=A0AAE9ZUI4_9BACT|nr:DinB family protein [Opitutaceae bacterium LMO-M01]WED65415.1 DinB family protein [Opitutaceae bacterium LMO-M01]
MKTLTKQLTATLICLAAPFAALANHHEEKALPLTNQVIIGSISSAADKMVQLANAIPEAKYDWMPMEGVASVSGVLGHVAGANYYIGGMLGAKMPEGVNPQTMSEGADKAKLIANYEASIAFVKQAIAGVSPEAMKEEIEFFGMKAPRAQLVMVLADHCHEHLGQMIAYARSNEVTPPWSR